MIGFLQNIFHQSKDWDTNADPAKLSLPFPNEGGGLWACLWMRSVSQHTPSSTANRNNKFSIYLFILLARARQPASQPDDEETRKECCQISWKNDDGRKKGEEEEEMWKDRKRELFFKCWNKRLLIGPKQTNRQTHRPVDHGTKKKGENRDRSSRERITHQSVLRLPELRRRRRRKRSIYPAGLLVCFASSGIFFICIKRIDVCGRKKNMPFFHLLGDF